MRLRRVRSLVGFIPFQIRQKLLDHPDQDEGAEDDCDVLGLVGPHRGEHLEDHVHQVKDVDHFGELEKEGNRNEVPPGVPRRLDTVGTVLTAPLLVILLATLALALGLSLLGICFVGVGEEVDPLDQLFGEEVGNDTSPHNLPPIVLAIAPKAHTLKII